MILDEEKMRKDLLKECEAGFFGGGIGSDFIAAIDIEKADAVKLIKYAKEYHLKLEKYLIKE